MRSLTMSLLFLLALPAHAQDVSGTPRAVDGDSLDFGPVAVRLHGIDAPELAQSCERAGQTWPCGKEAAAKLATLVQRGTVVCEQRDVDEHDRIVAACRVGSTDLGEAMVAAGLAVAFTRNSDRYSGTQARARDAKLGLWNGTFQMPADYRAANPRPKQAVREMPRAPAPRAAAPRAPAPPAGVLFRNCKEAWAAGAAPIYRGQPGYRPEMDGDGDGIACEPYRKR